MIITTDDLCLENLKYFKYWDDVKSQNPNLKVIAFTIANNKCEQRIDESEEFEEWYVQHNDWVEIGVHGYDHMNPPEQERDDAEEYVRKSLEILKTFLPQKFLYRPPGFQRSVRTEPMLKKLGFAGIAYQRRIRYFDEKIVEGLLNTHCCDKFNLPITRWKEWTRLMKK